MIPNNVDEYNWRDDAACAQTDPEIFHPKKGVSVREGKSMCAVCPVVETCLAYALANDEDTGIWGGMAAAERRKLKTAAKPRRLLTHCKNNHEYTEGNTYTAKRGTRSCRQCALEAHALKRAARKLGEVA
jgi:hypothetical protein